MKKILFCLFLFSGCASVDVYPFKRFVNLSGRDLAKEAKANLVLSAVDIHTPSEQNKNDYFSHLVDNSVSYRNYLLLECALLFLKDESLQLDKPVYVSAPKWNNVQNWYSIIFNFQSLVNNVSNEKTMECAVAVNEKKEVTDYQLKQMFTKLNKN